MKKKIEKGKLRKEHKEESNKEGLDKEHKEKSTGFNAGDDVKKKQNKQTFWVLIVIVIILGSIIGMFIHAQASKTFELAGLEWDLVQYGDVLFYHTHFQVLTDYHLYLRNNPLKNDIPADVYFKFYPEMFVTIDQDAGECPGAVMGNYVLGSFLGANGAKVQGALTNETYAKEQKLPYVNCSHAINKTVIKIQKSESPFIEKQGDCYIINVGNCENLKSNEKFILGVLTQMNKNA